MVLLLASLGALYVMMCHKRLGEDKPLALVLWSSIHCNTLKENQKVYSLKLENINQNIEKSFPRDDQRIPSAIRSTMPVTLSRGACITCSKKCSEHHSFLFLATVGFREPTPDHFSCFFIKLIKGDHSRL